MTVDPDNLRVGYVPYSPDLDRPGDRRRFAFYARQRGLDFEIADPAGDYDLVVLSGRADVSAWSRYKGRAKLVFDLVNAYVLLPHRGVRNRLRGVARFVAGELSRPVLDYRGAVEAMCRRADAVVCATEELADTVRPWCPEAHVILDSFHDLPGAVKDDYRVRERLELVWEGQPDNLAGFSSVRPALEELAARREVGLHLVTGSSKARYMDRFLRRPTEEYVRDLLGDDLTDHTTVHPWSPRTAEAVATFADLALIPLNLEEPLMAAKPANKLVGFWWMGVPALVSATLAYERAVREAGVAADTACADIADWRATLERYAADEVARREAGERGRAWVSKEHSDGRLVERWDAVVNAVFGEAPTREGR